MELSSDVSRVKQANEPTDKPANMHWSVDLIPPIWTFILYSSTNTNTVVSFRHSYKKINGCTGTDIATSIVAKKKVLKDVCY